MSYYTTGQTVVSARDTGATTIVRAKTTNTTCLIQLYISGELVDAKAPLEGIVEFEIPRLRRTDLLMLLAVDADEGSTDYFADAFPTAAAYGNRIRIKVPRVTQGYYPGDEWVVYRGDAGDPTADVEVYRAAYYPHGKNSGGFGIYFGSGGFGYDGHGCVGFGYSFGYGEFGFDCLMMEWVSEPLPSGVYPVSVVVEDRYGNAGTAQTASIILATYPRPAKGLTIKSYTKATDKLALTWTASPDIT